jgi:hypothetical protein
VIAKCVLRLRHRLERRPAFEYLPNIPLLRRVKIKTLPANGLAFDETIRR